MTNVQPLMCAKDDVWPEHRTINDYMQEELARTLIYAWAEVMSELYDSRRKRLEKKIVDLLHAENFELCGILETVKDVFEFIQIVRDTGDENFKKWISKTNL